jgi:hypothetical protein
MYKLYLDDIRVPTDSYKTTNDGWVVVRNYAEFVVEIVENGLPEVVSFDHDLEPDTIEGNPMDLKNCKIIYARTGFDCVKWLVEYCINTNAKLPECLIHSANPVGAENMLSYITSFKKSQNE